MGILTSLSRQFNGCTLGKLAGVAKLGLAFAGLATIGLCLNSPEALSQPVIWGFNGNALIAANLVSVSALAELEDRFSPIAKTRKPPPFTL